MKIKISELSKLVENALKFYGYNQDESKTILDVLMYAQLRGNNQGIVKLIGKGIPKRGGGQAPKIVKETPVSALVDGNKTHAMVVMNHITDLAIKKAKEFGVGIAGNFNTSESTGALGYYVKRIADKGLIGIAFSSSPFQTTAPHGSNEARFCTNPMAYGIPTTGDAILLDMTTSAIAYYGLIEASTAGKQIQKGVGYDSEGNDTTDPAKIMSGALKTLAGHKGSGLAFVVQVLAGTFVRADSFNSDSSNAGNLVIAIDPNIFVSSDEFKKKVSDITSKVKSSRKVKGVDEILVPGERGNKLTKERLNLGEIVVEDNLLTKLKEVANKTRIKTGSDTKTGEEQYRVK